MDGTLHEIPPGEQLQASERRACAAGNGVTAYGNGFTLDFRHPV